MQERNTTAILLNVALSAIKPTNQPARALITSGADIACLPEKGQMTA
jgi:hypothetical protein